MCSVQCFRGGNSLRLAFGSFFYFITCAYWGGMLKGSIRRQRHYFVSPKISLTFSRHPLLSSKPLAGVQWVPLNGLDKGNTIFWWPSTLHCGPQIRTETDIWKFTKWDQETQLTGGKPVGYLDVWHRECTWVTTENKSRQFQVKLYDCLICGKLSKFFHNYSSHKPKFHARP